MPERIRQDGVPSQEPERHDELSRGVAAARSGPQERDAGRFMAGSGGSASLAGAAGGCRHKGRTRLSHRIDAPTLTPESERRARVLRKALAAEIASTVGGGHCGIAASLFIKFGAQKTAAAEEAFARGDYEAHRKLTESARMDVLYAREHAAKEAAARPQAPRDFMAEIHARAAARRAAEAEAARAVGDSITAPPGATEKGQPT